MDDDRMKVGPVCGANDAADVVGKQEHVAN